MLGFFYIRIYDKKKNKYRKRVTSVTTIRRYYINNQFKFLLIVIKMWDRVLSKLYRHCDC